MLTLFLVVRFAGVEKGVVHNVTREDGKCLVRVHILDGVIHALFEGNWNVAVMVSIRASREL